MNTYRELSFERISGRFIYEPLSGQLIRRFSNGKIRELAVARERIGEGRFVVADVTFRGYLIKATHIIFMLMTECWPKPDCQIDHRDGDVFNCRWDNLREAAAAQSKASHGRRINADEGLEKGVYWREGKYQVLIRANGGFQSFGYYQDKEEANAVAREAIKDEFSYAASRTRRKDVKPAGPH
jgi:hypothetical protein